MKALTARPLSLRPISLLFFLLLALPFRAVRGEDGHGFVEITPEAQRAIERGLAFLARTQNPDGSWTDMIGRKINNQYVGHMGKHVGVTALACMSFMSSGNLPGRGEYARVVDRGLDFVLSSVKRDGFITCDESRMYSHAFATLFLAEVYGMTRNPKVKGKLKNAVWLIIDGQNEQGGWRYLPGAKDSDISITVCQVQALRAARNAGVYVPKENIDKAIRYIKASFIRDYPNPYYRGGFWYQVFENQPFRPSRTSFALTAAGVTALYGAGEYDCEEVREGLRFMFRKRNRPKSWMMHQTFDYYYGHYYAVQAFYQAGGYYWSRWFPFIRDQIIRGQRPDGSWRDLVGPHYATAMATLILQIPYRMVPIFER